MSILLIGIFWEGGPQIIDDNPNWPCQKLEVHIDV